MQSNKDIKDAQSWWGKKSSGTWPNLFDHDRWGWSSLSRSATANSW
jgi:hypothetical protein